MKIEISAGLVIIQNNKILLEHPTGSKWTGTYSIPKGGVNTNEILIDAALRETYEEIGIKFTVKDFHSIFPGVIGYNKNGKTYKRIFYFVIYLKHPIVLDQSKLQKDEVDWAGFLTKEEAESKMFWRQKEVLSYLL